MRLLFTSVPAHGHLLPLAPLMEAALDDGHRVAVMISASAADAVREELPEGVEHLAVGPPQIEVAREVVRRTGVDVMRPTAASIGEMFGGVMLDDADEALAAARAWAPGVIVAEMYSQIGPLLAAALALPWHRVRMTAAVPASWAGGIARAAARHYAARGLVPVAATSSLDLWPETLREPARNPEAGIPVHAVRARPHRRREAAPHDVPSLAGSARPKVLVTLGTTFSATDTLAAVVDAVAALGVDVLATRGLSIDGVPVTAEDRAGRNGAAVRFVGFAPLDALLDGVSVVVGAGGAGTVLAALSRGIPLVVRPLGPDQPLVAARVAAAGVGVVVDDVAGIGDAVAAVLADHGFRARAAAVAAEIAAAAEPRDVMRALTAGR